MSGTRGGLGRIVAMGVALALALLLVLAAEARASKFAVAQCGWYIGIDASWSDTTGGAKFRPDAWCVPPGADPFDGAHVKSFTRGAAGTVSGNRFAGWRWTAPPGAWITQVRGTWWHALHDGFEQRLGTVDFAGGFSPFLAAGGTDTAPREFVAGFSQPVLAFEDRLLCARAESKWCASAPESWSSLRALTLTLEDPSVPAPAIGGELIAGGWLRGSRALAVSGIDGASGIRFAETLVDGARAALTEFPCSIAKVGSSWHGTRMLPCSLAINAGQAIATGSYSDGPHSLGHCQTDFAGNFGCVGGRTILIDNNPPTQPRAAAALGEQGWRRVNGFEVGWTNPDQGVASPIAGAAWRLTGPAGYDSGTRFAAGRDRTRLSDLKAPGPGSYSLALWLRDEAGNEAPATAANVPLLFDDVPPGVAFLNADEPAQVQAEVSDAHAGPAQGALLYRRQSSELWHELPTKLVATSASTARLRAPLPELGPGTYLFRAEVSDAAGNTGSSGRRADGTEMAIRVVAPAAEVRARTRIFARLSGGRGRGATRTVPFGAGAAVGGRLVGADGAGLSGRELRVVSRPSRGSLAPVAVATVRTGERGGFKLRLDPGASRRISVNFAGEPGLEPSSRRPLELRVRSGVSLRVDRARLTTGDVLRLSGEVLVGGAAVPRRGKLVAIQYFEQATRSWRPVVLTHSDHRGRFRARYRFRYVSGVAEVRLRATALAEERWPFAPGSSTPVTVSVSGK